MRRDRCHGKGQRRTCPLGDDARLNRIDDCGAHEAEPEEADEGEATLRGAELGLCRVDEGRECGANLTSATVSADSIDAVALPRYEGSLGHNLEHHLVGRLQQALHGRRGRSPVLDRKILASLHTVDDVDDDWLQCLLEKPRAVQFHEATGDVSQDRVLAEQELGLRFEEVSLVFTKEIDLYG